MVCSDPAASRHASMRPLGGEDTPDKNPGLHLDMSRTTVVHRTLGRRR